MNIYSDNRQFWLINIVIFSLFLSACGGGGGDSATDPGVNDPVVGTSGKTVSGDQLGDGSIDNDLLHKSVSIVPPANMSGIDIDSAYLGDSGVNGGNSFIRFFMPVSISEGGNTYCTVSLSGGSLKDEMGNVIAQIQGAILHGSIRKVNTQYFNACLGPGEQGMFSGFFVVPGDDIFSRADSVEFSNMNAVVDGQFFSFTQANLNFSPESYTVTSSGFGQTISVSVRNSGSEAARISTSNTIFFLDDMGVPIFFTSAGTQNDIVNANQTFTMEDEFSFSGMSTRILVFVEHNGFNNF